MRNQSLGRWLTRWGIASMMVIGWVSVVVGPVWSAPAMQGQVMSDTEIVAGLKSLRSEMFDLLAQVAGKGAATGRPNRRTMDYESYRRTFEAYSSKIEDCYRRLSAYYAQIDRVYRTNPNSPLYKAMTQAYLDAKVVFDNLKSTFNTIEAPDTLRTEAVAIADRRLNERIATSARTATLPPAPAEAAKDIIESDDSRFIGNFDSVEMFLLVKGDMACYVMFGWKEVVTDDSGKASEQFHLSVVRSELFPYTPAVRALTPNEHLENALKLKIAAVEAEGEMLSNLSEFFARAKSYSRVN
ncbi:MAG: hypothetical protein NZ585_13920 [Chloracidobacterium sp.]|nr:hypothetical protein [Chloracidobacterium sp.]MDW8217944.1 hypothetical protein [Acidobacteriota bacterium]